MTAYYNENDPYAAQWLKNLIGAGLIADGEVDDRSIVDVRPADLAGFTQCHFFAGIGGWSLALRMAGWDDDRPVWTGSCPCQPFSVAGKRRGFDDERHLWPVWRELIAERRPPAVFGEQVASAAAWLAGVRGDLEALGYAVGAVPIEAASVGAPHKRDRYWFVADANGQRQQTGGDGGAFRAHRTRTEGAQHHEAVEGPGSVGGVVDADGGRRPAWRDAASETRHGHPVDAAGGRGDVGDARVAGLAVGSIAEVVGGDVRLEGAAAGPAGAGGFWAGADRLAGADGKARRVEPGICLLAHGVPARVAKLRAGGNAIVPQVAAEFIGAFLEARAAA